MKRKLTSKLLIGIMCSLIAKDTHAQSLNVNNISEEVMDEYKFIQSNMTEEIEITDDMTLVLTKIISSIPFTLPVGTHMLSEFVDLDNATDLIEVHEGVNEIPITYDGYTAFVKIKGVDLVEGVDGVIDYTDLDEDSWSTAMVREATKRRLMHGFGDGIFAPKEELSIATALSGFNRVINKNYDYRVKTSRLIVQDLHEYLDDEHWAYHDILDVTGRIDGAEALMLVNSGNRLYTEKVSRIALARFIYFTFKDSDLNTNSNDVLQFSDCYTEEAIQFVTSTGVMVGDGQGKFNPNGKVTREELASILVRLDNLYR